MPEEVKTNGAVTAVKAGVKTTELWVGVISTILLVVWPDFPKDAFFAIATWVVARSGQKMFGFVDPVSGKPAWQTSEFWLTIVYSLLVTVFPDMPADSLYAVQGWIVARTGVKVVQDRRAIKANGTS